MRGDQRAIAGYLLDEVLERQPGDLQRFLLETSILDELTAPLCAAVTGRADAGAVLARLARENLFVSALDDRDERYRYHHLFADLLRSRLERLEPERPPQLHRLAAAWFEAHDEPEPAIRHYLAAGDVAATVGLTEATVDTMLNNNLAESARRLVEAVHGGAAAGVPRARHLPPAGSTRACPRRARRSVAGRDSWRSWSSRTVLHRTGAASLRSSWLILISDSIRTGWGRCVAASRRPCASRPGRATGATWPWTVSPGVTTSRGDRNRPSGCGASCRAGRPSPGWPLAHEWNASDPRTACAHRRRRRPLGRGRGARGGGRAALSAHGSGRETHHSIFLPMLLAHLRLLSHRGDPETIGFARTIDDFMKDMVRNRPSELLMSYVLLGEVALEQGELGRHVAGATAP